MEERIIDIDNLPEGWRIEKSRQKSRTTGIKRVFILNVVGECVGATCSGCGKILNYKDFVIDKSKKFGISPRCRGCAKRRFKDWYENNFEKAKESNRNWKKNNINRVRESNRNWRKNNPEKVQECKRRWQKNNPEKVKEMYKTWQKNNPEKVKAREHKRRAKVKGNGGSYIEAQLQHCLSFFNGCCAYTGENLIEGYDLDHIIPVSKGGTSFIYNLVPATATANRSKGAKGLEEWYKQQPYYSEERLQKILEWQKIAFQKYNTTEQSA